MPAHAFLRFFAGIRKSINDTVGATGKESFKIYGRRNTRVLHERDMVNDIYFGNDGLRGKLSWQPVVLARVYPTRYRRRTRSM